MVCLFSVFVMSVLHPTLVAPSLQSSTLITTVTAYVTTCFGSQCYATLPFLMRFGSHCLLSLLELWIEVAWIARTVRISETKLFSGWRKLIDCHSHFGCLWIICIMICFMFLYCQVFLLKCFPGKVLKVWRSLEISAPPVQGCIECFLELVSHLYALWRLKRLYMDNRFIVMIGWLWVTIARVWIQYIEKIWKDDKMMEDNVRWWKMMEDDWRKCCGGTSSAALLKQQDCWWYMSYNVV